MKRTLCALVALVCMAFMAPTMAQVDPLSLKAYPVVPQAHQDQAQAVAMVSVAPDVLPATFGAPMAATMRHFAGTNPFNADMSPRRWTLTPATVPTYRTPRIAT